MNPVLGRFITADPYWGIHNMIFGSNPQFIAGTEIPIPNQPAIMQSLNLYVYVLNNPIRYIDPWGLWLEDMEDRVDDLTLTTTDLERSNIQSVINAFRHGFVTMDQVVENITLNNGIINPASQAVDVRLGEFGEDDMINVSMTVHVRFEPGAAHNQIGINPTTAIDNIWDDNITFGQAALEGFDAWNTTTDSYIVAMNVVVINDFNPFVQGVIDVRILDIPSGDAGGSAGIGGSTITIWTHSGYVPYDRRPSHIRQIAAHEMGHILGLDDNERDYNVMVRQYPRMGDGINIDDGNIRGILGFWGLL